MCSNIRGSLLLPCAWIRMKKGEEEKSVEKGIRGGIYRRSTCPQTSRDSLNTGDGQDALVAISAEISGNTTSSSIKPAAFSWMAEFSCPKQQHRRGRIVAGNQYIRCGTWLKQQRSNTLDATPDSGSQSAIHRTQNPGRGGKGQYTRPNTRPKKPKSPLTHPMATRGAPRASGPSERLAIQLHDLNVCA